MITELTIKNLRCFKDLSLENITPITLISGENNVGKTTLLEGIFLFFGYRLPDLFFKINNIRRIAPMVQVPLPQGYFIGMEASFLWETLFPDMDMTLNLDISVKDAANVTSSVRFEKDTQVSLVQFSGNRNPNNMLQPIPGSYVLNMSFERDKNTEKGRFIITQNGLVLNFDAQSQFLPQSCAYIGPNAPFLQHPTPEWLGKAEIDDTKTQIVDALRILDNEIMDIFVVTKNGIIDIYAKWSTGKPRLVKTLGDGINKLLDYLLVMAANPGSIILLDEIETGFHYSFYPKLWELIAIFSKKTQCQVFATTHSHECIKSVLQGTSENGHRERFSYIRLGRNKEGVIQPHYFHPDMLEYALNVNMEVR